MNACVCVWGGGEGGGSMTKGSLRSQRSGDLKLILNNDIMYSCICNPRSLTAHKLIFQ